MVAGFNYNRIFYCKARALLLATTEAEPPSNAVLGVLRYDERGWAVAQSPILVTTITLERLRKRGYESMLYYYKQVAPHLNEPLYTACSDIYREDPYVQCPR